MAGGVPGWDWMLFKVPPSPDNSMIPWEPSPASAVTWSLRCHSRQRWCCCWSWDKSTSCPSHSLQTPQPAHPEPGQGAVGEAESRERPGRRGLTVCSVAGHVLYADIKMENGKSKGCGVVRFESPEVAERACRMMNGIQLRGREIDVRIDRNA